MGIYERNYERDSYGRPPGLYLGGGRTMAVNLVIATFVVYVAQLMFEPQLTNICKLHADWFFQPWRVFELLTYGFLHDVNDLRHIMFNMFGLWMFGRSVEQRYGSKEFLWFYLVAITFAGLFWSVASMLSGSGAATMVGASGGIAAIVILFAFAYPHQKILFMLVIPMPAWVFGLLFVGMDIMGATGRAGSGNVAYAAHLGGALFAFLYFRSGWRIADKIPLSIKVPKIRRGPKLRVHDPSGPIDSDSDSAVDDILRKIQQQGQDSLTSRERRILEKASRDFQKKRK